MKKLFLLILVSLTMGCYAQTKVTEYVIGDFPDKGDRSYCLCVLNGDKGVLKFKNLDLVYRAEELRAYGNSIVLTSQNPNLYKDAYLSFSGSYDVFAYNTKRDYIIVETRNIPKSDWNNKIASYGMTVSRNETAGINEEAAGKLVIGGLIVGLGSLVAKSIRDLSDDRGSSSSSSSSSSSKPKYNIVHSKGNVDLLSVNCEWSWGSGTTYISLRNRNSYDVYVTILYFNGDEMLETKKYKIYGGSILEEHEYYMCADDASITSVQ